MASQTKPFSLPPEVTADLHSLDNDLQEVRVRLVTAYLHCCNAGPGVDTDFEDLAEADLDRVSRKWQDAIEGATAQWTLPAGDPGYLLEATALVRALDEYLVVHQAATASDAFLRAIELDDAYLIPRKRLRAGIRQKGQGMRRRLLLRHRVVPSTIDGMEVNIVSMRGTGNSADREPPTRIGAAMFVGASTAPAPAGESFVITQITAVDQKLSISRQVSAALEEGCLAIVWPELSMDNQHADYVGQELRRQAGLILETPTPTLQIVVAGTNHTQRDGVWQNIATIFDGTGMTASSYAKVVPYITKGGCKEDIVRGEELPIFITDDYVVSVAICKDITKYERHPDLIGLEVDLFLVPSLGGESTMDAHEVTAGVLKATNDTRIFVSQHYDERPAKEARPPHLGMVLATPEKPSRARKGQSRIWRSYPSKIR